MKRASYREGVAWIAYNDDMGAKDELVQIRYVSAHIFMGQTVKNYEVVETTITMGLIKE